GEIDVVPVGGVDAWPRKRLQARNRRNRRSVERSHGTDHELRCQLGCKALGCTNTYVPLLAGPIPCNGGNLGPEPDAVAQMEGVCDLLEVGQCLVLRGEVVWPVVRREGVLVQMAGGVHR